MDNNFDTSMAGAPAYTGPSTPSQIPDWIKPGTPNAHAGGFFGFLDSVMSKAIPLFVASGAAYLGGSALGLFGGMGSGVAGTGAAAGVGEVGLGGTLSNAGLGLENLGFLDSMATGTGLGLGEAATAGTGALAGAEGLGGMVGTAGGAIPSVTITGAAGGGGGGIGLGGTAALGGGAIAGGDYLSSISDTGNMIDQANSTPDYLTSMDAPGGFGQVKSFGDAAAGLPTGSTDWLKLAQQGGGLLNSLGGVVAGNRDRITNQQDQAYYDNLMNKMMGMYQPGTPEATLMEQQMNAKDAAAGRNSQYGVRATNLAGQLAGQRAQIMTSPTFNSMANASRGHYDNSLNSLFSAMGGSNNGSGIGGTIGQIGNGISGILGLGKSLFG